MYQLTVYLSALLVSALFTHCVQDLASASHMARWGVMRAELRAAHAKAELTDLQLLSVTRDLQVGF